LSGYAINAEVGPSGKSSSISPLRETSTAKGHPRIPDHVAQTIPPLPSNIALTCANVCNWEGSKSTQRRVFYTTPKSLHWALASPRTPISSVHVGQEESDSNELDFAPVAICRLDIFIQWHIRLVRTNDNRGEFYDADFGQTKGRGGKQDVGKQDM
jgi:hypothetical protein